MQLDGCDIMATTGLCQGVGPRRWGPSARREATARRSGQLAGAAVRPRVSVRDRGAPRQPGHHLVIARLPQRRVGGRAHRTTTTGSSVNPTATTRIRPSALRCMTPNIATERRAASEGGRARSASLKVRLLSRSSRRRRVLGFPAEGRGLRRGAAGCGRAPSRSRGQRGAPARPIRPRTNDVDAGDGRRTLAGQSPSVVTGLDTL